MDIKEPQQPAPAAQHSHEWSGTVSLLLKPVRDPRPLNNLAFSVSPISHLRSNLTFLPSGLVGWCAPCCLFGKTQSRLQDPALKEHSYVNGDCCLYALSGYCGLYWVLLMIKRGELRERFGIQGSAFEDCWQSYCCPCCTLVQNEKEVEARSNNLQVGYQAPSEMTYPQ
ncbi:PLAC8 family protein [Aspergillus thermomutatus]|uniref:DUF614 domain protein n=1 Tax=Aspergillus thermomutatus TaxID=41047 RepID=A0A397HGV5_ASPTH|nr:uncharacterized protein CDV56_106009 [Aspergillus thermomutatus]RHZ62292.1 hypothetical protein CDV56_106009 [Aspergillus thermomutatus]